MVGHGEEERNLRVLVKRLGLSNKVFFHGFLKDHRDVLKIIKSSHIFVSASTLEGFGISVLEAMPFVPLVLSDIPPFREITMNKALFFREESELVNILLNLLNDKKLYKRILDEQRKIVKKYDWRNIAKKWESVVLR